jgi:two-component system, OmpR family, response regulator
VRKLLVVDDRADVCEVIAAHLREGGDRVTIASDGAVARLLLARNRYDLAIIDVLMPGEGGIALADLAGSRGMAVLLMSGHPETMEPPPGREHCPLLRKPFRFSELDAALAALVAATAG